MTYQPNETFLYSYLNSHAPVGAETHGQSTWLRYIQPYIDTYTVDTYGSVVGIIQPDAPYKVAIEAHADEISWYVQYITPEGYMYVIRNGGSDYQIAPSMHAYIHTSKGRLPAVFGWPAIHVRQEKDKPTPKQETIVLDAGFSSKEEAEKQGVHVGSIVTFAQELKELNGTFWSGRALDNRIGGFAIAEVARVLHEKKVKLPFGLYIVNAVQEEVGHRGAHMMVERIKPDLAIITDVCHATDSPHYDKKKNGEYIAGKGPVIDRAPSVHPMLYDQLIKIAEKHKIPFQRAASQYYTGTDTDAFAYAGKGVPAALLSTPLRYMHTTVETVHKKDVCDLVSWFVAFIEQIDPSMEYAPKLLS